jgi:hypothetical protein
MSKYQIWDNNKLVPAFIRKPKDVRAERLTVRTIDETRKGIKYYIPASKIIKQIKTGERP